MLRPGEGKGRVRYLPDFFEVGDRVKAKGFDMFTSRAWEPGVITQLEGGVALVRFDNPHLKEMGVNIKRLEFESTEAELIEKELGDYFA